MQKKVHILVAWLVIWSVVTVGGILPHHHDANYGICFSTQHAHNHSSSQQQEGCPLESDFVASLQSTSEGQGSRCGLCDHNHSGDEHELFLFLDYTILSLPREVRTERTVYDPHVPLLCASWAKGVSLRAPPVC